MTGGREALIITDSGGATVDMYTHLNGECYSVMTLSRERDALIDGTISIVAENVLLNHIRGQSARMIDHYDLGNGVHHSIENVRRSIDHFTKVRHRLKALVKGD